MELYLYIITGLVFICVVYLIMIYIKLSKKKADDNQINNVREIEERLQDIFAQNEALINRIDSQGQQIIELEKKVQDLQKITKEHENKFREIYIEE